MNFNFLPFISTKNYPQRPVHLIITSATIPRDDCFETLGYGYDLRVEDYVKSFDSVRNFSKKFASITILETVAAEKIDYLEQSGFPVVYSKMGNFFLNKGANEVIHIENFLKNGNFKEDDLFLKLTGRYLLRNTNILGYLKPGTEFLAKTTEIFTGEEPVFIHFTFYFRKENSLILWPFSSLILLTNSIFPTNVLNGQ